MVMTSIAIAPATHDHCAGTPSLLVAQTKNNPELLCDPRGYGRSIIMTGQLDGNMTTTVRGASIKKQDIAVRVDLLDNVFVRFTTRMMLNTDDEATITAPKPIPVLGASMA
jgi:hypothetical protein